MKKEDKKRFSTALTRTKVSLPGINLTAQEEAIRIDVFWEALLLYKIEDVEFAFRQAQKELSFFPKPVELINFILEEQKKRYLKGTVKEKPQIEWMPPTEEGKKIILDLLNSQKEKWEKEDREIQAKRIEKFEKNRKNLQKQAKLLVGK